MPDLVLTREAVRELDRRAIEEYGIPSIVLMENAGRACAEEALAMLGGSPGRLHGSVLVCCGPGNNGGDGLVVARTLWNRGVEVRVAYAGTRAQLDASSADARTNARLVERLGLALEFLEREEEIASLSSVLGSSALVVDALFGTGLSRPLAGLPAALIDALNQARRPVLAVDLPSGLDADTGEVLGRAVRADVTVTFVARKRGFGVGRGPELCGRVRVAEIGIPRYLLEEAVPG